MKNKQMFNKAFITFMMLLSVGAFAQSNDGDNGDDLVVNKNRIPDAPRSNETDDSKSNDQSSGQVFKPTEEISEDLPVSFPVDI